MRPRAICTQAIKLPSQIVSEISGADEQIYLYIIYEAMKEKGKCIIRRKIMDTSALKDYKCDVILVNMTIVDNEVYLDGTYRHMINKIKHLLENDHIAVDISTRDVSLSRLFCFCSFFSLRWARYLVMAAFNNRPVNFVPLTTSVKVLFSTSSCIGHRLLLQ